MTRRHRQLLVASATAATLAASTALATASTSTAAPPGKTALAACTGTWQPANTTGLPKDFRAYGIKVFGAKKAVMTGVVGDLIEDGGEGFAAVWNGTRWTTTNLGPNISPRQIAGTSTTNIVVNSFNNIVHFDGKTWKSLPSLDNILGDQGWITDVATNAAGDIWVAGSVSPRDPVSTPLIAHYFGGAWKVVPNNLANSGWAVPSKLEFSPTGELWAVGADFADGSRKPFAGKVVGGRMQRSEIPQVPGQPITAPSGMTWDNQGRLVVNGWAAGGVWGPAYPYSSTKNSDGSWKVIGRPAVLTGSTFVDQILRIGSKIWTVDSGSFGDATNVSGMSTLESAGWSQPRLTTTPGTPDVVVAGGAPDGTGLVSIINPAEQSVVYRSICGTPPASPGVPGTSANVTPPPLGARATSAPTMPRLTAAERKRAAMTGTSTSDGLKPVSSEAGNTPLDGPVIDRLRSNLRSASPSTYVGKDACGKAKAGSFRCFATVVASKSADRVAAKAAVTSVPYGYGAAEYRKAYGLPATGGKGRTVAVVAAYGYPTLEADLAEYRKASGLPACTVASGCLRVTGQDGGAPPPAGDIGWEIEQALDVQTVSAICPDCKILVVQAKTPDDVLSANKQAAAQKPWVINNSFGRLESSVDKQLAQDEIPKDVPIVAASGDDGLQLNYPATVPSVIGVGGTRLLPAPGTARGWREDLWSLSGGGCSTVQPKPAYQKQNICRDGRSSTVSLVANADPGSGGGVYYGGEIDGQSGGWLVVGGTSLAAPITAASFALRGIKPSNAALWSGAITAKPITTKFTNGWCAPVAECTSSRAFNGATGFGYLAGK